MFLNDVARAQTWITCYKSVDDRKQAENRRFPYNLMDLESFCKKEWGKRKMKVIISFFFSFIPFHHLLIYVVILHWGWKKFRLFYTFFCIPKACHFNRHVQLHNFLLNLFLARDKGTTWQFYWDFFFNNTCLCNSVAFNNWTCSHVVNKNMWFFTHFSCGLCSFLFFDLFHVVWNRHWEKGFSFLTNNVLFN